MSFVLFVIGVLAVFYLLWCAACCALNPDDEWEWWPL